MLATKAYMRHLTKPFLLNQTSVKESLQGCYLVMRISIISQKLQYVGKTSLRS